MNILLFIIKNKTHFMDEFLLRMQRMFYIYYVKFEQVGGMYKYVLVLHLGGDTYFK